MKKIYLVIILGLVLCLLFGSQSVVHAVPPWPSSFYGQIQFVVGDNVPIEGDTVYAYVPGVETYVASSQIVTGDGSLWYQYISVPGDDPLTTDVKEGGLENDIVTFKINGRIVATGTWISGVSQRIDFHPPKANAGGPYDAYVDVLVQLSGLAEDLGGDVTSYAWDLDNDGAYDDSTDQNPTYTFTTTGTKTVGLKVTDSQGGEGFATSTLEVTQPTATITLNTGDLEQTYSGTPKTVGYTVDPEWLTVTVTYDGSTTAPTNAGSYAVVATVVDNTYVGSASGTLEIAKAAASITLGNLDQDYDSQQPVSVTTNPTPLNYTITYGGSETQPSTTGAYEVEVTITDSNYAGTTTGTLVIRATHSITLVPGWNLVSFNLQPYPSKAPVDVLSTIDGSYDLVYTWDASGAHSASGHWMMHDDIESSEDSLMEIDETLGIWIHVTGTVNQTLNIKGFIPDQTSIGLLTTANGWNLVGFPASANNTLVSSFSDVGTSLSLVYEYDASAADWKIYNRIAPSYVNDLETLRAGFGYWVMVSSDATWNVIY